MVMLFENDEVETELELFDALVFVQYYPRARTLSVAIDMAGLLSVTPHF